MILVDTKVLGELCRPRPAPAVQQWATEVAPPFRLSVASIEEIHFGLSWKPNARIENWFQRFVTERCEIFPVTGSIARRTGESRGHFRSIGQTRTQADMLIAATAQAHQLALATRNVRDFENCGIAPLNPIDRVGHQS